MTGIESQQHKLRNDRSLETGVCLSQQANDICTSLTLCYSVIPVRGRAVQKICKQLTARPYGMDQKLLSLWTAHMWIMRATADVS